MSVRLLLPALVALLIALAGCGGDAGPNDASRDMGHAMASALRTLSMCDDFDKSRCSEAIDTMIGACLTVELARDSSGLLGQWRDSGRVDQSLAPACATWEKIALHTPASTAAPALIDLRLEVLQLIGD